MPRTTLGINDFRPPVLPTPGYTIIRDVVYTGSQRVDIWKPNTPNQIAVIVLHGGAWDSGDKSDAVYAHLSGRLADMGFAVFNANYSLVGAPGYNAQLPIDETLTLVGWVRDNAATYNADSTRVGMVIISAGGHLGYMAAITGVTGDTRPDAVVGWSPGTDLPDLVGFANLNTIMEAYMGNTYVGNEAAWEAKSPQRIVTSSCCPMRTVGSDNEDVAGEDHLPVAQFDDMHTAALAAGIHSVKRIFSGAAHGTFSDPPVSHRSYQGADDIGGTSRWLHGVLKPTTTGNSGRVAATRTSATRVAA